jgi:hypothetical protein
MASDEAPRISPSPKETSTEQSERSLADQHVVASTEAASSLDAKSDHDSQSKESGDGKTASDNSKHLKVAAMAILVGTSYDFGQSLVMTTHLTSMESYAHYFPKGHARAPSAKSVPDTRANEAAVFEDFFTIGLRMPPHLVLVDILRKFRVQLHQLTSNAIIQNSKFIWAVTFCGGSAHCICLRLALRAALPE